MATKAKLTIVLKADDTVVAEIEDGALWQRVLSAIHSNEKSPTLNCADDPAPLAGEKRTGEDGKQNAKGIVSSFARTLGVSLEEAIGALSPSLEPPYLTLDRYCWQAMKKGTPASGRGSLNPTGLAGTLLALWLAEAKLDITPTQALSAAVLGTLNVEDKNPGRGIKNTKWLQARSGGVIIINPAEITKAVELARAFCAKSWAEFQK